MVKSETERARYRFRVKEGIDCVFIVPEPANGDDLKVLGNGFLSLDLPPGTDYKRAEEIVRFLNENITAVAYTRFL